MSKPRRRWYWPREIWRDDSLRLWLAPTFFGFGLGVYAAVGDKPTSATLGFWPLMLTWERPAAAHPTEETPQDDR